MSDTEAETFEEAVKDLCRQFGLSGHETVYQRVLIGSLEWSTAGIYNPSTFVSGNIPDDLASDIRRLHDVMMRSQVGRDALTASGISGEGVPVIHTHNREGSINPIYLLPSQDTRKTNAVENFEAALTWRKEKEAEGPVEIARSKLRKFNIEGEAELVPNDNFVRAVATDIILTFYEQGEIQPIFDKEVVQHFLANRHYGHADQLVDEVAGEIHNLYYDDTENGFRQRVFYKIHEQDVNTRRSTEIA